MATPPLPKNSILIQQLCKHIATLEDTNARLHQQLSKADQQQQFVCTFFAKKSWNAFIDSLRDEQKNKKTVTIVPDFQDTSSTFKSRYDNSQSLTAISPNRSPIRQRNITNWSALQSPIQSQSRLLNKSIRGQTDRQDQLQQIQNNQNFNHSFGQQKSTQPINFKKQNLQFTLNELNLNSIQKQCMDLKSTEQQNVILSIQNTKLRQKVAKLQAIVVSQSYK